MSDKEILDKHFKDVPASSVLPEGITKPELHFDGVLEKVDELAKHLGVDIHKNYNTGKVSSRNIKPDKASKVIGAVHRAYFDMIRQSIDASEGTEETKNDQKIQVTRIEQAFDSLLSLPTDLEKKLDINSVLFRMYGSLNELIKHTIDKL